jgi:hypothetical protein
MGQVTQRKDYRTPSEIRRLLAWHQSELERTRESLRVVLNKLDRIRIEVHRSIGDAIADAETERQRAGELRDQLKERGKFIVASEWSRVATECRHRAAILRQVRGRIIAAGLGVPRAKSTPGGEA